MNKKIIVKQDGFKDCAVACLLSIIRFYGGDISKEELSLIIKTTREGTNGYNLINGAKEIGFDGYGMKYTPQEIFNEDIILPFIAHTKKNNMYHFIVVYEINKRKNRIKIMDPSIGLKVISYEEFNEMYLGSVIILYPVNTLPNIKSKTNLFEFLLKYLIPKKQVVFNICILSLFIILFNIINNFYFKILIDNILINKNLILFILLTLTIIVIIILKNMFTYVKTKAQIKLKEYISLSVNSEVIKHIFYLPYNYFKRKTTGEIVSRVNDVENFKDLVSDIILDTIINLILIIFSMFILLIINKTLFMISIITIICYSFISLIYKNIFKNKIYSLLESNSNYNSLLTESINNYESFKNLNILDGVFKKIIITYRILTRKIVSLQTSSNNQNLIKNLITDLGVLLILVVGSLLVIKNFITLGDLVSFYTLVLFFFEPIKNIVDSIPNISHSFNAYERINELMKVKEEVTLKTNEDIKGDIIIKNLSYSYNNVDYIIKGINLNIKEKDKILLYGSSGIGKSTFVKLILKYVKNYQGEILINNRNLLDIEDNIVTNSFTCVSQKETLINGTLKENILMDRNVSLDLYEKVLSICKVDEIRNKKKFRDNYLIEENGFNLSGGERQKIILARALLKESNYLILDEALSEVSVSDEKEILNNIFEEYKDKTIIYISHKEEIKDLFKNKYNFNGKENYA